MRVLICRLCGNEMVVQFIQFVLTELSHKHI